MNVTKVLAFSIGPIGASLLGLVTLPIIAWFFAPEDLGRLSMLQVVISFSVLLFTLGLDQAYVREFHEVDSKTGLLKAVVMPGLLLLVLVTFTILLLNWPVSKLLFDIDSFLLTVLVFFSIFVSFFSRFLGLILRMQERGLAYSMSQLLPKLFLLIIVLCYVYFDVEPRFHNLMIANALALMVVLLVFAWNTRKIWVLVFSTQIRKAKLNEMLMYSIPLVGSAIAYWGLTSMDKVFLRALVGFDELAIYAIAVTFAGAALVFQAIFSTVWAPTVYKWAAEGVDPKKIKNIIDYVTLGIVCIWALAGMFSWLLAYILPPTYRSVPYILLAAMANPLLYTLAQATGIGVGIKRKTMFTLIAAISALIVNALGNWYLIPSYGAAGAALASAIAFMIFFIIRTESSAALWIRFDNKRMYGLIISMVALSFVVNIWQLDKWLMAILYTIMLLVGLLLFPEQRKGFWAFVTRGSIKAI
jgi:O-antigen/teichoic acid export membrane protein